jgi:hypothetical protein
MKVLELAVELRKSGWQKPMKILILAARYYKNLETEETLRLARVSKEDIEMIKELR